MDETIECLLCGDPSATVKTSKRKNRPYMRCEACESILFTYSDLGGELLRSGGAPVASNPKPSPAGNPTSDGELVAELKRVRKRLDELEQRDEKRKKALKIRRIEPKRKNRR